VPGTNMVRDTDPDVAHWKCAKCGEEYSQKKRKAANKPPTHIQYQLGEYEIIQCHPCGTLIRGDSNTDSVVYVAVLPCFTGGESLHVECRKCHAGDS